MKWVICVSTKSSEERAQCRREEEVERAVRERR
mgnify:CR=1 FL=1